VDNPQNVISFCTGYGGLELGIGRAGVDVRIVCNVEIEAFVQANLVAKIEEGRMADAPIWTDLKTFPASIFRGKVCGIIGGYPCQPFSSAGKRKGEEDPRHLWPYIRKHVRTIRPLWCFFENVQGHATMGLWRVLSDLEEEGYETTWGIFSAEEVGAPHQRKRVFILGRLSDSASFGFGGTLPIEDREGEGRNDACGEGATEGMGATELGNPASERPRGGSENCAREQSEVLGERLESDELGNTKHDGSLATQDRRSACEEQEEGRMQELEGGCKQSEDELANPTSRQPRQSQTRNGGQDTSGGSEEELGNTTKQRPQDCGEQGEVGSESEATSGERSESSPSIEHAMSAHHGGQTQWPARPGEEQYEWEEPRVTEIESFVRGAIDGTQHRVDRLRLLGNGVVPQTAELAWTTLWKELMSPSPQEK